MKPRRKLLVTDVPSDRNAMSRFLWCLRDRYDLRQQLICSPLPVSSIMVHAHVSLIRVVRHVDILESSGYSFNVVLRMCDARTGT